MMTVKGAQRILDFRVFRHNFGRFPNYIAELDKDYQSYRLLVQETHNHPSIRGHGMYFKHKKIKLDQQFGNYQHLWNEYFAIS
ncbi:hypothetical protein ES703_66160 [subsurface metagenome]